jgi:hypothetical protein
MLPGGVARGGASSSLNITFGHGARHLVGTGLSGEVVESAIAAEIRSLAGSAEIAGGFWGRLVVEGQTIEFRAYLLEAGKINVGTFYPIP